MKIFIMISQVENTVKLLASSGYIEKLSLAGIFRSTKLFSDYNMAYVREKLMLWFTPGANKY